MKPLKRLSVSFQSVLEKLKLDKIINVNFMKHLGEWMSISKVVAPAVAPGDSRTRLSPGATITLLSYSPPSACVHNSTCTR